MTQRRPEYTRPYSAEYLRACGCVVNRVWMVHPAALGQFIDEGYVSWLESELEKARKANG